MHNVDISNSSRKKETEGKSKRERISPYLRDQEWQTYGTRAPTLVHGKNLGGMHCDVPFLKFLSTNTIRRLVNFATKIYYGLQQRGHTQPLKKN